MTARATDPATSHLGAVHVGRKLPTLKAAFLDALQALGQATANEIAKHATDCGVVANAESVRKRAKELLDAGYIRPAGTRVCKVTGQQAGTMELVEHANAQIRTEQKERSTTERREGTSDSGRDRASSGDSQSAQCRQVAGVRNQAAGQVSTPDSERIKAAVEFVNHERDWIDTWRAGMELSKVANALGTWPIGTTEEYIVALESAAGQGLIDRDGGRVRRKRVAVESKVVQGSLFDAD